MALEPFVYVRSKPRHSHAEILVRVDREIVDLDFVMNVIAGGTTDPATVPDVTDDLPGEHCLARRAH